MQTKGKGGPDRVQTRLDEFVEDELADVSVRLESAREELAACEATRERLQSRLDLLAADLAGWRARVAGDG